MTLSKTQLNHLSKRVLSSSAKKIQINMKCFIVLSALVAVALARPGHLLGYSHHVSHVAPLTYAAPHAYVHLAGAPIGHDGRVVDTPEVAHAKAEHAAAHAHAVAQESSSYHSGAYASAPVAISSYHGAHAYHTAAPIGHDGRVVDTPEVAHAKAEHAAAHAHAVAQESASYHSGAYASVPVAISSYHGAHAYHTAAPIGHDGRVVDTPEVAHAKAAHAAAHAHEKASHSADLLTYAAAPAHLAYHAVQPVTYAKYVSAAPIGHDGRVVDTPEVAHAKAEHLAAHAHAKSYAPHYVSAHQWW